MKRKGFILEEQAVEIKSASELKAVLKKFIKEISSVNLKAYIYKLDISDKRENPHVSIRFKILCPDDKWLENQTDRWSDNNRNTGCAQYFYFKNEYEEYVNKLVFKYFQDYADWSSTRSSGFYFDINNFTGKITIKDKK